MAKRARGTVRPGQRRPIDRTASSGVSRVAPRPATLSDAELARAAELEAQLLAEERAAEAARRRTAERGASREIAATTRSVRFEDEYAYVARDVRDIVRIAIILLVVLFTLYLIIDVFKVVRIG